MTKSIQMKLIAILIDALIVYGLSFLGGFLGSILLRASKINNSELYVALLGISGGIAISLGFFIVGMRTNEKYWWHLSLVALCTWLGGLLNLLNSGNFYNWFFSIILIFFCMVVGGGLRLLIPRKSTL